MCTYMCADVCVCAFAKNGGGKVASNLKAASQHQERWYSIISYDFYGLTQAA